MAIRAKIETRAAAICAGAFVLIALGGNAAAQPAAEKPPVASRQSQSNAGAPRTNGPLILQPAAATKKPKPSAAASKKSRTRAPKVAAQPATTSAQGRKDPRIVGFGLEFLNAPQGTPSKTEVRPAEPISVEPIKPLTKPAQGAASEPSEALAVSTVKPASAPPKCDATQADAQQVAKFEEIAKKYCASNSAALEQVRLNWQQAELEALEKRVKQSLELLDKKIEALQILRKEAALDKARAEQKVVAIIAEMRPDAAAQQISSMEPATAVSVLAGLPPKAASLILNEMQPKQAAQLTQAMADAKSRGRSSTATTQ